MEGPLLSVKGMNQIIMRVSCHMAIDVFLVNRSLNLASVLHKLGSANMRTLNVYQFYAQIT